MKKFIEVLCLIIIPGLLVSAVITEIYKNGVIQWSEIPSKPSVYFLAAYLILILTFFLGKKSLKDFIKDQREKIIKSLKDEIVQDLKKQIKKELTNELNQQIRKEAKRVKGELKGEFKSILESSFKYDLKRELHSEMRNEIQQDIEKATSFQTHLIETHFLRLTKQNTSVGSSHLYDLDQFHHKIDSISQSVKTLEERVGG